MPTDDTSPETPKPAAKPAAKPHAHLNNNGKSNRADQHKGHQQKPTKQRIQRHQGR